MYRTVQTILHPLLGTLLLTLLAAGAGFAAEAAAPAALQLLPAVPTPAATRAMILDSAVAGTRLVAVGDHGIVLLSDDGGKTFRQAKAVPVRSTLTSVCFADAKNGWAVGHWGVILATVDGGESWQLQRSDLQVDQPLFSVCFRDPQHGFAVGLWSLLLTTADGGRSWQTVTLPPPPGSSRADLNLQCIFTSAKGSLLITGEQGTVLRSADGGTTWSYVETGYRGSFWTGLALRDGTLLVAGLRGTIYRSGDDGRSWQEVDSGVKSSITALAESGRRVVAVGLDGTVLQSGNDGATFTGTQRDDRIPFTTLAVTGTGSLVAFSKGGVVADFTLAATH